MLRYCVSVFGVASLVLAFAGIASAGYFADLSAMAPLDYYNAIPDAINNSGAVSMQGYSSTYHSTGMYYHTYLYTGGTAGTVNDISSLFTGNLFLTADAMNASGQMAAEGEGGYGYLYGGGTNGIVTSYKYAGGSTGSLAINANGDVGGYYINSSGTTFRTTPIVYTGGTSYALNLPTGDIYNSNPAGAGIVALNTSGQAVGISNPSGGVNPPSIQGAVWTYTISGGSVTSQTATDIRPVGRSPVSFRPVIRPVGDQQLGKRGRFMVHHLRIVAEPLRGRRIVHLQRGQPRPSPRWAACWSARRSPGSLNQEAGQSQAINDSGAVVGCIVNSANSSGHDAAIWHNGTITDLNTLYAPVLPAVLSSTTPRPSTITATSPATDTTPAETRSRHLSCRPCCPATPMKTARSISTT